MNKKLLFLLPLICLIACTSKGQEHSHNSEPLNPSSDSTPSSSDSSEQETYETKTVVFKGASDRTGMTKGSQMGTEAFTTAVTALFNSDSEGFLTSIEGASCAFQNVDVSNGPITSLTVGTGKYAGNIKFNFSKQIVKLDFTIQAYHSFNDYQNQYNMDTDAEVSVEGTKYDLSLTSTDDPPEEKVEHLTLTTPKNNIQFSNEAGGHRVYIHSVTLYYK